MRGEQERREHRHADEMRVRMTRTETTRAANNAMGHMDDRDDRDATTSARCTNEGQGTQ
jgi:hypothetical protein